MQTPTLNLLHLEVTAMPSSFVRERSTTDEISNNAHEPLSQGMSGSPHRWTQSLSRIKEPIPRKCKIIFLTKFPDCLRLSYPLSLADLTDASIFPEKPNPLLFPGISSGVEVHSGFANEQAKYVTHFFMTISHADNDDEPKDRIGNSLRRQNYSLDERHFVCHRCRPLSRRGTRPPRRGLPQPEDTQCGGDGIQLRHAPRREPGFCQFCRQPAGWTRDAREQQGGPHPDCAPHIIWIPSPVGRDPYTGFWRVGRLPRCVYLFLFSWYGVVRSIGC